jgi:hypothetical protein
MSLGPPEPFQTVHTTHFFDRGTFGNGVQERFHGTTRSPLIGPLVDRVLKDWVESRDHTPAQQALLKARDEALDPRRTIYIHLETEGHPAILRVFDGSTEVLRGGTLWPEASASPARTPLEIGAGESYQLPERVWSQKYQGRPAYVWELGLLNIDRQLKLGVETAFSEVARLLDLHYNDLEFNTHGTVGSLSRKNMVIYAQTLKHKVGLFSKYGLKPVWAVDSAGNVSPFEVAPRMVLMSIKAEDFIRMHSSGRKFVRQKGQADPHSEENYQKNHRQHIAYMNRIDSARIPLFSLQQVAAEADATFRMYVIARRLRGEGPERDQLIIAFFERYLRLVNSIPEKLRHEKWSNLRNLLRDLIGNNPPSYALYYLENSIRKIGGQDRVINQGSYLDYLQNIPQHMEMLVPTQPTLNMKFTAHGAKPI